MSNEEISRFWAKVQKTDSCWLWNGNHKKGYGRFYIRGGKDEYAHRISYLITRGVIPKGLCLDHLCRNPGCVRPDHLEAVTWGTNVLRGVSVPARNAAKTECDQGHPLFGKNLEQTKRGERICKACKKVWRRRYYLKTKELKL